MKVRGNGMNLTVKDIRSIGTTLTNILSTLNVRQTTVRYLQEESFTSHHHIRELAHTHIDYKEV